MRLLNKQNISTLFANIDNILLDCDGVIWGGAGSHTIINNANLAIKALKNIGKKVFLVTNSSVRSQQEFLDKCKCLDIDVEKDSAISAPYIMCEYLKRMNFEKKIYVIGTQGFVKELTRGGFKCIGPAKETLEYNNIYEAVANGELDLDPDVGAVAVGFDGEFNYGKILKANCYLSDPECLLLGNSIDVKFSVSNTKYSLPACGVMVRAVETASGREATIMGKPSTLMFEVLASQHNLVPERTLMIGDTLQTDIVFGNRCGLQTLLVLTGVASIEDVEKLRSTEAKKIENAHLIPQYYLPSLGDLVQLIE